MNPLVSANKQSSRRSSSSTLEILGSPVLVVRKRQKNMYLSVRPDGTIRVTCQAGTSDGEIIAFVSSHADWLRTRVSSAKQRARTVELEYISGDTVPLWGRFLSLRVRDERPYGAAFDGEQILLRAPAASTRDERAALIELFYRAQMKAAVPPLLRRWQPFLGVEVSGLTVRSMTSRWGSCNTRTGRVCLNLRLVEKDPRCLEYVVVHELCHRKEMNHSRRFWAEVEKVVPDYKEKERWLKENGPLLQRRLGN